MKRIKIQRVSKRILARCAAVLLVVGVGTLVAFAGNPTMFLPIDGPIGIAASPERILVMTFCDDPRQIMQVDGAGVVTPFATLPPREPGCLEDDIHFSSGLGGWPAGYVFATQGTYIYKISPDGAFVSLFAMIPTAVSGLVFDKVGSFGYDMIVIGGYSVYRVTPAGTVTMLGGFNERVEGPDVAPMSFGPYGGFLFAGANSGYVMAMAPTGGYTMVVPFDTPGRVHFVPEDLGTLNGTELSYFTAAYPDGVVAYPQSDFAGLAGQALVASESGAGVRVLSWDGSAYVLSPFCTGTVHHEMSDFVESSQPRPIPLDVDPRTCPNQINANAGGQLQAAILGTDDFDVRAIDPTTVRLAGVAPWRSSFADVATPFAPFLGKLNCTTDCTELGRDRYLDISFRFDQREIVRALGTLHDGQCVVVTITGNTRDGRPFIGEDVLIIRKRR